MKKDEMAFIVMILIFLCTFITFGIININREKQYNARIDQLTNQRDALSDAIKCYADNTDTVVFNYADYYLRIIKSNKDSLYSWSYCY